jgi:hypothetical protein
LEKDAIWKINSSECGVFLLHELAGKWQTSGVLPPGAPYNSTCSEIRKASAITKQAFPARYLPFPNTEYSADAGFLIGDYRPVPVI